MQKEITKKTDLNRAIEKRHGYSILFAFILIEVVFLYFYGIRSSWDSIAYLQNAEGVLNGQGISQDYLGYASYIYYLVIQLVMGGGNSSIALGQIVLAGISVLAFYQIAVRFLSTPYGFWASVAFAVWPTLRYWDAYLYTDSMYVSMITICLYLVILIKEQFVANYWLIPLLLFTSFVRPPALLFTASLLLALSTLNTQKISRKRLFVFGLLFLASFAYALFLFNTEHAGHLLQSYQNGEIIYPNVCITPPSDVEKTPNLTPFILHNPLWVLKLGLIKLWYFLSGTKPYYSLAHNTLTILTSVFLYMLSGLSIWHKSWKREELVLIISFFACNILMVAITAENWDGRFHLPLLPFLLLMCAKGIEKLSHQLANKNTLFS